MSGSFLYLGIIAFAVLCCCIVLIILRLYKKKAVLTKGVLLLFLYSITNIYLVLLFDIYQEKMEAVVVRFIDINTPILVDGSDFDKSKQLIMSLKNYTVDKKGMSGSRPNRNKYHVVSFRNDIKLELLFYQDSSDEGLYWVEGVKGGLVDSRLGFVRTSVFSR